MSKPAALWGATLLLLAGLCLSIGCTDVDSSPGPSGTDSAFQGEYPYTIVTTCGMVTDIVKQVAGDRAQVVGLMGADVDPHLYKPTRGDVQQLTQADVVFYSGLMLEGRMADTFAKVGRSGVPVYPVTDGLNEEELLEPEEFAGHWDPHVWMDVSMWSQCVDYIAEALSEFDPANSQAYQDNAAAYREQLAKLDDYARQRIASIPKEQRVLVTAHDAFGYFARAYDIKVRSVQGISTESEASLNDINSLVSFVVDNKIKAIFVESSVNSRNIQAVIEGAAAHDWEVKIGGELFSDAMGKPGTYEGTYVGMIDHNATLIARALGGEAPEGGLNGKLSKPHEGE